VTLLCIARLYRRASDAALKKVKIYLIQTEGLPLNMSEMINRTRNRTNNTWAIQADVPAIPVNPKIPAIMATIKKTMA
jgi:hypothetical protein